ncbi:MAG: SH3 domain-containing protein [Hyphomicrobiales bacterium]|nr:SH3 domain-containing protein [Hyphomicrobiales bacterium]
MTVRSLAIAVSLVIGIAAPAIAHAAYTTAAVNVRSGPSTRYYVIATAPPGAWVKVHKCVPRWCKVNFRGVRGWMSAGYIAHRAKPRVYAPRPYYAPKPYYRPLPPRYRYPYVHPYFGYRPRNNFGIYFGFGG